jgi:hypothetical protein
MKRLGPLLSIEDPNIFSSRAVSRMGSGILAFLPRESKD